MARYIDAEGIPALFDEEFKKTRKLISKGETHLDNLAEGFTEADRVIRKMPTADVAEAKWISVDDKLPEEDTRVLVAVAHSTRIDTDRRIDGMWVRWGKYVTHWQALPELPRTPKERGGEDMSVEQIFYCSNLECVKEECPRHYKHIDVCYKPQEARDFSGSDECLNR